MPSFVSMLNGTLALPSADEVRRHVVVSFDIFDTLLVRPFSKPVDLFRLVEWELRREFSAFAVGWAERRIVAERHVRQHAWKVEKRSEIRFQELRAPLALDFNGEVARRGLELEVRLELQTCRARPDLLAFYNSVRAGGRRIVLVSDIYMSEASVEGLLRRNGYDGYERLFVSSAMNASKANGELFPIVVRELGVDPASVLHIGDDEAADGRQASAAGLRSVVIPKLVELAGTKRSPSVSRDGYPATISDVAFWDSVATSLYALRTARGEGFDRPIDDDLWRRLGYFVGGPAIHGFARFVLETCRRRGLRDIWFMARDGLIVKQSIERLGIASAGTQLRYVQASRRCFNVAAITKINSDALDFLCSGQTRMRPEQFLVRVGIDPSAAEVRGVLARHFPKPERLVKGERQFDRLRAMFFDLEEHLVGQFECERTALVKYFSDLMKTSHDIAIVDVGWHGSLQRSLLELLEKYVGFDGTTVGIYFGTFQHVADQTKRLKHVGYLFDHGRPADVVSECRECIELIELFFAPPQQGLVRMVEHDGRIVAELSCQSEELERMRVSALLHEGVFAWLDDLKQAGLHTASVPLEGFVRATFNRLLQQPTPEEGRLFGGVPHSEGFMAGQYRQLVPPPPPAFRPLALRRQFRRAFWRQGYRSQLGRFQRLSLDLAMRIGRK